MAPFPPPLVPPEVSLGGNEWFPLYHRRLRKSRWWRGASDLARSRNVDLWCAAFEETPAGSLPDDDLDLAEGAGYGRDVEAFRLAKAEIMAPWTYCADGRWYHPALCEVVLEMWERTSERRKADRARQAAHRRRTRPCALAQSEGAPLGVTRDTPTPSRVTPPHVTHEGASQVVQVGQTEPVASAAPSATARKVEPWDNCPDFLAVWDAATPQMRRRAKSKGKTWVEWVKVMKTAEPAIISAGLRVYLREDPDVQRTGGPGLHIWLRDRTYEQWQSAAASAAWTTDQWAAALSIWRETGSWGESLGPKPGEPGCRAPAQLVLTAAPIVVKEAVGAR